MAFVAERVVGDTAGAVPPGKRDFGMIREFCERHGVLLILDVVMCGMGALLRRLPGERFGTHSHVGDIRGRGPFQAIELVEDRSTKLPFDPGRKLHARVKKAAIARGLIVYPMGGSITGVRGDHVPLAPPFIVISGQIGEIVDRLGSAVDDALA